MLFLFEDFDFDGVFATDEDGDDGDLFGECELDGFPCPAGFGFGVMIPDGEE